MKSQKVLLSISKEGISIMINYKRLKRAPLNEPSTLKLNREPQEELPPNFKLEDFELILKTIVRLCKIERQRYGSQRFQMLFEKNV